MQRNAFSNDVSCSWYELNLHPKDFICVVSVESYYDGKKFITENITLFYQTNKHLLIIKILWNQNDNKFLWELTRVFLVLSLVDWKDYFVFNNYVSYSNNIVVLMEKPWKGKLEWWQIWNTISIHHIIIHMPNHILL